ncbi:deoxyribose-phosphate aldolase [Acetivibrio clariflavus]|uniref:Deoxyribose-phosphate aldolase n=1 Tax=Acetivibrio clariflavus (strain DSM 19732 / NBRC 101661 / EBR45) TaxID=720554 RepID=G8LTX3_ACECE|nr:deoxyribose-phosphate aldolase [Acetivibrio clariflavus]AEV67319.1 deoxyribose-phosphate aldolase [Acetivibrio clariflavus DSM 19732]HOQ00596.1 deoxyribose-phosphate aldolase [Acetivibrio clariflavus]
MDKSTVLSMIDHAILKPEATDSDLEKECAIAAKYNVASVCVKPSHVKYAAELLKNSSVKVSTVIGFPHGTTTTKCKVAEAREAIENGAVELDMVLNIGKLLSRDFDYVEKDIKSVVDEAHSKGVIVKVILETALLDEEMIAVACKIAEKCGADFVKTSTGFNGRGASLDDIKIMKNSVSDKVGVKASGGIKNFEQAVAFVEAGCTRLGTSSTANIAGEGSATSNKDSNY